MDMTEYVNGEYKMVAKVPLLSDAIRILEVKRPKAAFSICNVERNDVMYVSGNPKTKKQIKDWLAEGKTVTCFAPGLGEVPHNGTCSIEGPHYPKPHKWYGTATIKDGKVIAVK